jgi:hypothetical protein
LRRAHTAHGYNYLRGRQSDRSLYDDGHGHRSESQKSAGKKEEKKK